MKLRTAFTTLAVTATALGASTAQAAFTMNAQIGVMRTADGSTPITEGTIAFIADEDLDGFGAFGSADTFASDDAGDRLLGVFGINNAFGFAGAFSETIGNFGLTDPLPANTPILAVFYDNDYDSLGIPDGLPNKPTTEGVNIDGADFPFGPGAGVDFGIVDFGFELPNNNVAAEPFSLTTPGIFGTADPALLFANDGTTIPEPGTALLAAAGGLMLLGRRRSA